VIQVSQEFYRSDNETLLVGHNQSIEEIGWTREYDIGSLIEEMIHPPQVKV